MYCTTCDKSFHKNKGKTTDSEKAQPKEVALLFDYEVPKHSSRYFISQVSEIIFSKHVQGKAVMLLAVTPKKHSSVTFGQFRSAGKVRSFCSVR